jgi:hypothetical protein
MQLPQQIIRTSPTSPKQFHLKIDGTSRYIKDRKSYVNVCLVDKDGRSLWHRFNPILDEMNHEHDIYFKGNISNTVHTVFIAPECCEWNIDRLVLFYNVDGDGDKCNEFVKVDGYLKNNCCFVLPELNIVEVDLDKQQQGNQEYEMLKRNILLNTAQLIAIGTIVLLTLGEKEVSLAFTIGGSISIIHHRLLQNNIDNIEKFNLNNIVLRLGIITLFLSSIIEYHNNINMHISNAELLSLFSGLLTSKFAIYIALLQAYIDRKIKNKLNDKN